MTNIQEEIWKDIPNYEGLYQVSSLGSIKSIKYSNGKLLKPHINKSGKNIRFDIELWKDGKSKTQKIHRLVIGAFKGEKNLLVDHINGDSTDNRIDNLRYCNCRENLTFDNVKRKRKSRYVGVTFLSVGSYKDMWKATIWDGKKSITIGYYKTDLDAHLAYMNVRGGYNSIS